MENTNHYKAQEGYTYKRVVDGYIMGNELYLYKFIDGTDDVIENYEEVVDENYVKPEEAPEVSENTKESVLNKVKNVINNKVNNNA